jgi:putative FmdB family regulatory protein
MPIYEFKCQQCGHVFDKFFRSMSSSPQVECPKCHSTECRKNVTLFGTSSGLGSGASAGCAPTGG